MARPYASQSDRGRRIEHAVVLGAGMAGLSAAAALAPQAQRVSVVERDPLPGIDRSRKGVPQGAHVHLLLPGGLRALDELLPGLQEDLRGAGAQLLDRAGDFRVNVGGGRLKLETLHPGFVLVGATRPLVEGVLRERVQALDNVRVRPGLEVLGMRAATRATAVTGVRLRSTADGSEETLSADLVVDATGRGSRAPRWLEELGYRAPHEERVHVDVRYTTRVFRRAGPGPGGGRNVMIAPLPGTRRGAVALAVEGERWVVTLTGLLGEQAPRELEAFRAFARSLWSPDVDAIASACEPWGEAVTGAYPANVRRRYDQLRRFPAGFVVIGDALASFNPLSAQGMSLAALEALALRTTVERFGAQRLGLAFFRSGRDLVDAAWSQAVDNDLKHPAVLGRRTLRWRLTYAYSRRLMRVARVDPLAAQALFDVMALLAPAPSLLRPGMLRRVLLHGEAGREVPALRRTATAGRGNGPEP
ncbi:MAG: FAD-binding protein [Deinococcales bacterium]